MVSILSTLPIRSASKKLTDLFHYCLSKNKYCTRSPGVCIGSNTVIGAGKLTNRDILRWSDRLPRKGQFRPSLNKVLVRRMSSALLCSPHVILEYVLLQCNFVI